MQKKFEELINNSKYQVFLFTCPAGIPLNFARHPWFIINNKGSVERWEIFQIPQKNHEHWGHLHHNALKPTQGIPVFSFWHKYFWKGRIEGYIEGAEGSIAQKMAEVVKSSPRTYPDCYNYALHGVNSNTYAQWVLNQFPTSGLRLPWNSFGKNFK